MIAAVDVDVGDDDDDEFCMQNAQDERLNARQTFLFANCLMISSSQSVSMIVDRRINERNVSGI